ncbi:MAG: VCBS repeat-containing protein [Lewinellaceae bacterium]|nr:VCBS repeat-containing protein [Lewinellaceae bacterium]
MFELIAPESSGIAFANRITEDHQTNILTNSYMYNGGGVAVLDVNKDGLPDLYFVSSQESNRLYLNKGDMTFEDITDKAGVGATGGYKTGVTVVDINADGWEDLYVCRAGLQAVTERRNLLYINNGDMTFSEQGAPYGIDDIAASNHANFFDYDLDGDLDLYLINYPNDFSNVNQIALMEEGGKQVRVNAPKTPMESDHLYRNEGNGKFTDVSQQAGISNRAFSLSVTVSDFNADGYPDIYVANDYIEPDFLYINNKNGTFTNRIDDYLRHQSNHTMGVDIADFNNDSRVDIMSLDMIAEDNRRQKLLMSTMMVDRYETLVRYGYGKQLMRNTLQLNMGEGGFSEVGVMAGVSNTDWSWSPLLADFDNDGWKDLYITNGYYRDVTNMDYLPYTVDSVNRAGGITPKQFPDFNDYLKLIPSERLPNYMYRNKGDLTFEKVTTPWGLYKPSYSNGSAYADLDADGDLDLVVNNIEDPAFLFKNLSVEKGKGNFLQIALEGNAPNTEGTGASIKIDQGANSQYQEMTPTRGFLSSVQHLIHFGLSDNSNIDRLEVRWPDGSIQVLENIKPNQRLVLKQSDASKQNLPSLDTAGEPFFQSANNLGLDFVHQENPFEDFNRERLLPHRFSTQGPNLAVADVNGDGLEDIFVGGAIGQAGALFLQQKNSTFHRMDQEAWSTDRAYEDTGCLFFDADGDGDQDLYVVSGGSEYPLNDSHYQDRLYLNDGKGHFSAATDALPRITSSGSCVSVHDIDGDGDLDVLVGGRVSPGAYPAPPQSIILRNEQGRFKDATDQVSLELRDIGMVTDFRWGDLDGDGNDELVVSGEWMPVTVFSLEDGKLVNSTEKYGLVGTNGWWNCLAVADVDGDGDQDILAGNLGLNTRLHASKEGPLKVYAKDFDGNGSMDPILSFFENGKEYPLPRRENLIKQLPGVKKKFVYFGPYSQATIDQVFAESDLNSALVLNAYEFRSMLFLNSGKGTFQARPLPPLAQIAPGNQFCVQDINQDGLPDILLVGNNYSADTESGPYDAGNGLLLLGNGAGDFTPQRWSGTGLWANKDARDLEVVHLADGRLLYLIANNNDRLQAYIGKRPLQ